MTRARELLKVMIFRDLRGRTGASFLGYGWIVVQPLLATVLYTVLVRGVLHVNPSGTTPYPVFVFAGMAIWNYFATALTTATESLVAHGELLRQVRFPRAVLVLYPSISRLIDFGISWVILLLLAAVFGVPLGVGALIAPLLVTPALIFAFGLSLMLAPLHVATRDVGKALPLLLNFAIFAAPVLYPLERVPATWQWLYLLNPIAATVHMFRSLVLNGEFPELSLLALTLAVVTLFLLVGQWLFGKFVQFIADIV